MLVCCAAFSLFGPGRSFCIVSVFLRLAVRRFASLLCVALRLFCVWVSWFGLLCYCLVHVALFRFGLIRCVVWSVLSPCPRGPQSGLVCSTHHPLDASSVLLQAVADKCAQIFARHAPLDVSSGLAPWPEWRPLHARSHPLAVVVGRMGGWIVEQPNPYRWGLGRWTNQPLPANGSQDCAA